MVPVLNHLIRPTWFMVRSIDKNILLLLDVEGKGSTHHLIVAEDLLSKVSILFPLW